MRTWTGMLFGFICLFGVAVTAAPVGSATCLECHDDVGGFFQKTAHNNAMFLGEAGRGCEACHGDGSVHVDSNEPADIRGASVLRGWTNEQKSQACLSCHSENIHGWSGGVHEAELSCWDCHGETLHFQPEAAQVRADCRACHKDMAARTRLQYRHPVGCASCHDPHGDVPRGEEVSDLCLSCHREYQGPYVYEHGALDDGCQECHDPHGSATPKLLKMTGNGLCLSCHTQTTFPAIGKKVHSTQLMGGAFCYDCHTDVHGSNTDPNLSPRLQ